jgi:hypothetical protein
MLRRSAAAVVALVTFSCGGGGNNTPPGERDVTGNYTIRYDDQLRLQLNVGGAVREVTQSGYGGVVDFGMVNGQPATIDLTQFCARPEVKCPSESFWAKVAVDQPDLNTSRFGLQKLVVINDTQHVLDAGVKAEAIGGRTSSSSGWASRAAPPRAARPWASRWPAAASPAWESAKRPPWSRGP